MSDVLLYAAIFPVVLLCYYIYKKDVHKESAKILTKLFVFGFFSAIPIIIVELLLGKFFPTEGVSNPIFIFINVFIAVAFVEEGFKWIITKKVGYDGKEFDEIYDIIVYSVYVSLGFACIENILYVMLYGFGTAVSRALLSIPGHTCFAIAMGYFMAKAKIGSINNNKSVYIRNLVYSILISSLIHTVYDALIFCGFVSVFFLFDILMVILCFRAVNRLSKMQINVINNVSSGNLVCDNGGNIQYNNISKEVDEAQQISKQFNFCPICGRKVTEGNFCSSCGFKLK